MKKLHLANGTVYLEGYINIDVNGELASNRPDLVERNKTTIDKYYKYSFGDNVGNIVTDIHLDMRNLSYFQDNTVDEIFTVNSISHVKKDEFINIVLKEWYRVLKPKGLLIIDVNDRQKQAQMLVDAKTQEEIEWALRLIYCHQRTDFDLHRWGYTPRYLCKILEDNKFKHLWTRTDYIIHDAYPTSFQICVEKI